MESPPPGANRVKRVACNSKNLLIYSGGATLVSPVTATLAMRRRLRLLLLSPLLLIGAAGPVTGGCSNPTGSCCKVCKQGKPCGDTCIAKTDVCHVGAGCACQG